ncbi:MAG TPA: GNAT family N-acetyltransferase [Usitatibacter sp.]|jgi:acetyltransferase|nr:GNAT family N-acetyltransferase [Usitatibacter sp.]
MIGSGAHYLTPLFEPRSVALVGASESRTKVGGLVLDNLLAARFGGELFAVNPSHTRVRGVPCVPDIDSLPGPVDLAVIATPAASVPGIVEQCGRKGIHAAVVISAGFSETGPAGAALERELLESARRNAVRLLGPNCVGLMRPSVGLNATFARGQALPGSLALVSQSGAVCTALLDWATPNGVGFSSVISLGGSMDLDFGEAIDYLANDPKTEHILLYIEGVRDGRGLVGSMRAAARAKPIILMKVGRHPAGSRAAVSHTGAIVGDDDVFDAVVRRTGAVRVHSLEALVDAAQALASHVKPRGERLAIVTNGGGPGVMAADRASDLNLPLASLAPETVAALEPALPATWSHGNPLDLIGDADAERYRAAVAACLADPGVDGVVAILTPQAMTDAVAAAQAVAHAARGSAKPVLAAWMGQASVMGARAQLRAAGFPVYADPEMAVEAFAHLAQFHRNQEILLEAPPALGHVEPPDLTRARAILSRARAAGATVLSAAESQELLDAFRIPVVHAVRARTLDDAVSAAGTIGFPVAMKIDSPDISHKSDVGGVCLGIRDAAGLRAAHAAMMRAVAERRPEARVTGMCLEPMVARPNARELMVGIKRDSIFGPVVAFGAGGIAVEVLKDREVALPPLNSVLVADMIRGTRVGRMLGEFRNRPAVDRAALEAVILRLSEMAVALPEIDELDVNPLLADETGVLALDARVVLRSVPAGQGPYAHLAIHPYPAELATRERIGDAEIELRPIRPEDAGVERTFVSGLSARSARLRFASALRDLTPAMLARFTQIDYDREMALIAVVPDGQGEREIGVCRYIRLPDRATCEYAIAVADEWQGKGLGSAMMRRLIAVARERGLSTMVGWVDSGNAGMLGLCGRLGFRAEHEPGDHLTRRVVLDL